MKKNNNNNNNSSYEAKDIYVLEGLEPVRRRPGMYIGSTGTDGLHHLIWEVVDNSIDEAMAGYATLIKVILEPGSRVKVEDNGLGFDKEDEANFFQKFYRGKNVKNINVNGTGIGLFVCRRFIENHHGQVWAHSPGFGHGSEFGFWIPIDKGEDDEGENIATVTDKNKIK